MEIKRTYWLIISLLISLLTSAQQSISTDTILYQSHIEDIILDVYEQLLEIGEADYEELHSNLLNWATNPIDLNAARAEDLEQLQFLNPTQIDAILLYVHQHPMNSIAELDLISELHSYEIRNLRPFVTVYPIADRPSKLYAREIFHYGKHDIRVRIDGRNLEDFQSDPIYTQLQYQFNYKNRVQFGINLRRYPSEPIHTLQHSAYIQLNDMGIFHTIVAGNYQAHFGQGLVVSNPYHQGKTSYVAEVGIRQEGLKKYTNTDANGLSGAGTTMQWVFKEGSSKQWQMRTSFFYSLKKNNDSLYQHTIGANMTFQFNRWKLGTTIVENLYSDSVRYYTQTAYNQSYFRGRNQSIIGIHGRYHWNKWDVFGELAVAQNSKWGVGLEVGSRWTPISDVGLTLLYRYYSPKFDNVLGYAFSETSRVNDENGIYIGADIKRVKNWRFCAFGDVFRFSNPKYGISYFPSWGYDAMAEAQWLKTQWNMLWRIRAREKAKKDSYAFRYQLNWEQGGWKLRTQTDANIVMDSLYQLTWGVSLFQDIQYRFSIPLTLQLRVQAFDVRQWDNRIYVYENDVLYASSSQAIYGCGGHFYVNLRWQIIPKLTLYFKVSETIYTRLWAEAHQRSNSQTDIHLLIRLTL